MSIKDKIAQKLTEASAVGGVIHANSTLVADIIQAFKDEGWYPPEKIMHAKDYGDLMTKQQFYERFVKEFDDIREPGDDEILDSNSASQVLEAARKAAGLE